jgi:DNA-binding beta-propeller fold protein YncE
MRAFAISFLIGTLAFSVVAPAQAPAVGVDDKVGDYKVVKTQVVGGEGRWDYVFADSDGRKLYVPRSAGRGGAGKSRVDVYDLDTLAPVGTIPDTNGVHGVAVDPKSGRGFVSCNPIVMFDTHSLATIKTIPTDGRPDGIFFEPGTERVYVLSHEAPNVTVLDGKDGTVVGTIDLGGEPEQGQSDGAGHVYIDLENKDAIAVVDATTLKKTGQYDLAGKGTGPSGLGLDAKNHILFAFCHEPQVCVVLSADDGKVLDALPIGKGVDGGGFNPNTMEAFSSQGDGTVTIIKENTPTSFAVAQNVQTMRGARTCTVDLKTNQIYVISAQFKAPSTQAAATQDIQPHRGWNRPQMIPGTFTILAIGKN